MWGLLEQVGRGHCMVGLHVVLAILNADNHSLIGSKASLGSRRPPEVSDFNVM